MELARNIVHKDEFLKSVHMTEKELLNREIYIINSITNYLVDVKILKGKVLQLYDRGIGFEPQPGSQKSTHISSVDLLPYSAFGNEWFFDRYLAELYLETSI